MKMHIIHYIKWFSVAQITIYFLSACNGQPTPNESDQTQSLPFYTPSSIQEQTLVKTQSENTQTADIQTTYPQNRPLATWLPATEVWNENIFNNMSSLIQGPDLDLSDLGQGFVALHKRINFDSVTGGYISNKSIVLNRALTNTWTQTSPFPSVSGSNSQEVEISVGVNGNAYAIWLIDDELYFNHYNQAVGWSTEISIGSSDVKQSLLVDANGDGWIFWTLGLEINLQQFVTGDGPNAGLQAIESMTVDNAWIYSSPALDANGTVSLSWITNTSNTPPITNSNNLNLIQFNPSMGWGQIETAPLLSSLDAMGSHLNLVASFNDEILAISQDMRGSIFAITFSPTNRWGSWENLDYNLGRVDRVTRAAKVAKKGDNNIMVIWTEATKELEGTPIYGVYSNKYNAIPDANGKHWPAPQRVGSMTLESDNAGYRINPFRRLPNIALLPDGRAIATWHDGSGVNSILHTNQYNPASGWNAVPDTIANYDRLGSGEVKSPNIALLSDGTIILSWLQEIANEFSKEIHVWVAEGQIQ